MTAAHSLAAAAVTQGPASLVPPSFNGGESLFLWNLFLMTAMFFLGLMMAGKQARRIWAQRMWDHPLHPVTLYRAIAFLAGFGLMLRCGTEALYLWGWNPDQPATVARIVMAKRWLDPIALCAGLSWMVIVILGEPGIEHQLRKAPLPVDMWSRWPALARPLLIVILSFTAALVAVTLR